MDGTLSFVVTLSGLGLVSLLTWYLFRPSPLRPDQLTDAQRARLLAIVRARLPNAVCPLCKYGPLSLATSITYVREFNRGDLVPGAPVTPLVQLICDKCCNTMSFSAIKLGVVNPHNGDIML